MFYFDRPLTVLARHIEKWARDAEVGRGIIIKFYYSKDLTVEAGEVAITLLEERTLNVGHRFLSVEAHMHGENRSHDNAIKTDGLTRIDIAFAMGGTIHYSMLKYAEQLLAQAQMEVHNVSQ